MSHRSTTSRPTVPTAEARARALFEATFGSAAEGDARAPGRVNLMGDHTDYNGGFVLPIAIDRDTHFAFRPRADTLVRIVSEHGEPAEFDLADLSHGDPPWSEYVRGVAWALQADPEQGWEGAVASDVPLGAGLSSSASLEIAAGAVFDAVCGGRSNAVDLALAGQRAENEWLGLSSGIMDQLACAAGRADRALLIDCRDLSIRPVLISPGIEVLRDLTLDDLERSPLDDEVLCRRARHVVSENQRTLDAAEALSNGDASHLGSLMIASHESLRDDFEVSGPELDAMVETALASPGCIGARMTGGGFAGCAVALVESAELDRFIAETTRVYRDRTGLEPSLYVCNASDGTSVRVEKSVT
jgi:galactokinase